MIITGKKVKHLVRCVRQQMDSKRLSDVLVHKRLRGQIYIRLLSKHRTSVCCPSAVRFLSETFCCVGKEKLLLNIRLNRNNARSSHRTVKQQSTESPGVGGRGGRG